MMTEPAQDCKPGRPNLGSGLAGSIPGMHADHREIARVFAASLAKADAGFAAEQAVQGVDALGEIALHPILAAGLAA